MATRAEATVRRRPSAASSWFDRTHPVGLIAPSVAIVVALTIFPLVFSLWVAFVQYDFSIGPDHPWVGLDNFADNWRDPVWRASLWRTAWFSVTVVAIELVLGMLLALAMLRPFRGRRVLMTMFVVPLFISPVVVGGFFDLFVRRPYGVANQVASWVWPGDVTIDFTIDTPWLYIVLFMADVWQWTPFIFVILLAGLAAIPDSLYEAADLDGAKPFQAFRFVTLPLLLPIILIAVTFRLIDAAKMFDIIFSLTRGGPAPTRTRRRTSCTSRASSCSTSARARPARGCS